MTPKNTVLSLCQEAKSTSFALANQSEEKKNKALRCMVNAISHECDTILKANNVEVEQAKSNGLNTALIDRLLLTPERFQGILDGIEAIIALPDPVGRTMACWSVPSGLNITRTAIPLGVIGVIYESRPNVTADAAALCLKSGNAVILRGGSECEKTNRAIVTAMQQGLKAANIPVSLIQYIHDQSHSTLDELIRMDEYIDVLIPRGGKSLMRKLSESSRIPVFSHLAGLCHTYIHEQADPEMALKIITNAKMRRTGICGATETLLIDAHIAPSLLPQIVNTLTKKQCEIRGDKYAQSIAPNILPANEEDWHTEYLDAILSVKIVQNMSEAIDHIQHYGSGHTDAIITENETIAEQFLRYVNSANVMHNCSTQFADGGEFGLGAEIGIATGKLHARGPVGLEQLTTFKYQVKGAGQIRP